ncbi:MAG: PadR family transcriptional regulator [Endomicrobiaceae bacterium]|nr:PadR family transcriptional regulator [Endomicrobiaceae bacterium]
MKKTRAKQYRHAPAFTLLFLAREKHYGQSMLNTLNTELPCFKTDSAVVYRNFQELEDNGLVKSFWETEKTGTPRKWYEITKKGLEKLAEYKTDIEKRKKNFEYFLKLYDKLTSEK